MVDNEDDLKRIVNISGFIVIFGFISSVFLFITMLILGGINNYLLGELLDVFTFLEGINIIDDMFVDIAVDTASTYINIMNYLDLVFLGALLTLIVGSLIFSYNRPRLNYFSIFSNATFGLIIFIFLGGILLDVTSWFQAEIMYKVFPNLVSITPIFTWYLDNMALVNLVLFVANMIATFVDFNFARFNKKSGESEFNEI